MKIIVECEECSVQFEMIKATVEKRKERYGKILCLSCSQKGNRNPIYNKKSGTSYKERRKKIIIVCDECHKEFSITQERSITRKNRYDKNLCLSCSRKGERNTFYGKKFTEEQLILLSKIRKEFYSDDMYGEFRKSQQAFRFAGQNNPMYKDEVENVYWRSPYIRNLVLKANNFTCQKCRDRKYPIELDAHHILSVKKDARKRLDLNNIACLCVRCHRVFHLIYGKVTNQDQFEAFIESSETIETILKTVYGVE